MCAWNQSVTRFPSEAESRSATQRNHESYKTTVIPHTGLVYIINSLFFDPVPTRGRESRYKLPGPGRPEEARGPTMLHMFLSFSHLSIVPFQTPSPSHSATDSLSNLLWRFLVGPPLLGWKVDRFFLSGR